MSQDQLGKSFTAERLGEIADDIATYGNAMVSEEVIDGGNNQQAMTDFARRIRHAREALGVELITASDQDPESVRAERERIRAAIASARNLTGVANSTQYGSGLNDALDYMTKVLDEEV